MPRLQSHATSLIQGHSLSRHAGDGFEMHSMLLERYRRHYIRIGGNTPSDELKPTGLELRSNRFIHCLILRLELM